MSKEDISREQRRCKYVNGEQIRLMLLHRYVESEKVGYDLGETSLFGWIEKSAADFREWAESLPYHCVRCGYCDKVKDVEECEHPFIKNRIDFINNHIKNSTKI